MVYYASNYQVIASWNVGTKNEKCKMKTINDLNVLLIYFCICIQYADPSIKVEIKCFHLDYVIVYFEIEIMNVGCICKRNVTWK